jgi:soluble lytic murein transglycosylase-like protein
MGKKISQLNAVVDNITVIGAAIDLDPELLAALVMTESSGNPNAMRYEPAFEVRYVVPSIDKHRSCGNKQTEIKMRAFSYGLTQIMGLVARENGFDGKFLTDLLDIDTNLELGGSILRGHIKRLGLERGLVRYNGSSAYPGRVTEWLKRVKEDGRFR